jgi:hypothetical protein
MRGALSSEDVSQLEELFKQAPFLRKRHERQQGDPSNEALRRVALARTCTRDLYDGVLKDELAVSFDELIARPEVEPVPQMRDTYWLREAAQRDAIESWASDAEGRKRWAEKIYRHAQSSGAEPLELAVQELRFDADEARDEFRRLYDDADAANNLPRCNLIVETLNSLRADMIGTPMDDDRREYASRYAARAMFLVEYHRTAAYYPRLEPAQALDEVLVEKEGRWILHLFAGGGMGKTMFLQSAISRSLVTYPERALVARLDMDFLSVHALTRCPWLMAIEIGRQIDRQLPQPAFDRFLASMESFSGLLYSPLSERYQALSRKDVQDLIQRARNLSTNWSRLISIMASLPRERKIVIVVDTIEEVSLYYPAELRTIVRHFEDLKRSVPQLRLVLSGRYELGREHLKGAWDSAIAAVTHACELRPFSEEAAMEIARTRLLGKPDELVAAVVRSAGGFPFKLAMLIELILDNPSLTAQDIEQYRDADVAYVIERVIKRIGLNDARRGEQLADTANEHQSLRWVVRYGAIPRKLTLSFLKNVMKEHLDRALSGEAQKTGADDPRQDVWSADPEADRDPDTIWKELTNYTSERGWIAMDPHDPELASFHPDIVNPLRRLLREQRVFVPLHEAAAKHFRMRSESQPERWAEWKAAELYHLCEAGDFERAASVIGEAGACEPPVRVTFYDDVLRSRDFERLPSALRADTCLAFADASVAEMDYDYAQTGAARERIAREVLAARALHPEKITPFWDLWLRAESHSPADLAYALQTRQLATNITDADRQRLCLLLASVHAEPRARVEALSTGLAVADLSHAKLPLVPAWVFRRRLSQEHERGGNLMAAHAMAAAAIANLIETQCGAQNPALLDLQVRSAEIDLSLLRIERAQQTVLKAKRHADLSRLNARMQLMIENPWAVRRVLDRNSNEPEDLLLLARAAAQQLNVPESLALFDRSEQGFERAGSTTGTNRVRISRLRFLTLRAGLEPRILLDTCPASDQPGETALLRAYGNLDRPGYAASILQTLDEDASPSVRARAFIAGLVWGALWGPTSPDAADNVAKQLVETLERIAPASARLALLETPLLDGSFPRLSEGLVRELEQLFLAKPEGNSEAWLYCLRYADLLRALGRHEAALETLTQIRPMPNLSEPNLWPLTALRRRRLIEDRIHAARPGTPVDVDPPSTWTPFKDDVILYAAVLLETAGRALSAGDVATAEECLQSARPVLETGTRFAEQYRQIEKAMPARRGDVPHEVPASSIRTDGAPPAADGDDKSILAARSAGTTGLEGPDRGYENRIGVIARHARRLLTWRLDTGVPEVISVVEDPALEVIARSMNVFELTELIMRDWREVAAEFARVVSVPWLVVPDRLLAAVPWELCGKPIARLAVHDRTLRIALSRLNVTTGQLTAMLARQWAPARQEVLPPVGWVALPEGGDADSRTSGAHADVPDKLERAGITSVRFPDGSQGGMAPEVRPGLVYLGCGIDQLQGTPTLTLNGLTAITLGHMLAGSGTQSGKPVVILDPPRPYSLSEAVQCLYWRNLFAEQLMETGTVSAVLALGLATYEEQRHNLDRLFKALHEGAELTTLLSNIRSASRDDDDLDRIVATRAAALFTQDPRGRIRHLQAPAQ